MNLRDLQLQSACREGIAWVCMAFPILRKGGEVERAVFLNKLLSYKPGSVIPSTPEVGTVSYGTLLSYASWFLDEVGNKYSPEAPRIVAEAFMDFDTFEEAFNKAAKAGLDTRFPAFAEELLEQVPVPGAKKKRIADILHSTLDDDDLRVIFCGSTTGNLKAKGDKFVKAYYHLANRDEAVALERAGTWLAYEYDQLFSRLVALPNAKRLALLRAIWPSDLKKKAAVKSKPKKKEPVVDVTTAPQTFVNTATPAGVVQ